MKGSGQGESANAACQPNATAGWERQRRHATCRVRCAAARCQQPSCMLLLLLLQQQAAAPTAGCRSSSSSRHRSQPAPTCGDGKVLTELRQPCQLAHLILVPQLSQDGLPHIRGREAEQEWRPASGAGLGHTAPCTGCCRPATALAATGGVKAPMRRRGRCGGAPARASRRPGPRPPPEKCPPARRPAGAAGPAACCTAGGRGRRRGAWWVQQHGI